MILGPYPQKNEPEGSQPLPLPPIRDMNSKVLEKVATLNYSGLLTVEAIQDGFETPLIDEYGLRDMTPDIQASDKKSLATALAERRAELASQKHMVVGRRRLAGGIEYNIVDFEK